MPATKFICPSGKRITIKRCLASCPQKERYMFLPTLRAVAESLDRGIKEATVTELISGVKETYLKKKVSYAVDPQEHFDAETVTGYFLSGKLTEWLEDRYYEDEAEKLRSLDKDAPDFRQQLCSILGVEYAGDEELDVAQLERLNEKKALLRQKTSDEEIISHAAETALTQEDLADLLDMDVPVIYLCGEKFNVPIRVENKKYVGILGTPKVTIKANSQEDLDAKGIVFENVQLPWGDVEEKKTVKSMAEDLSSISRTDWPVPFEKMHKLFVTSFAKEFAQMKEFENKRNSAYYNHDKENVWTVVAAKQDVELDETQKEIALSVVCDGEYDIDEIVYIRVNEDLSAGWALTKDSFCATTEDGTINVPYKYIQFSKEEEFGETDDYGNYEGYRHDLGNSNTGESWEFYVVDDSDLPGFGANHDIVRSIIEPCESIITAEALERCLKSMKSLFKKK